MFPLSNGKLIRLNQDGTNGEVIQSNKTKIVFGTSILYDHHIKDVDQTKEVSCEISTDDYGRITIANKSTNEIFVNDKPITSVRPLFNNSIIKICDGVEFRWIYKQAKENIGGKINDADFASWSDPAKKNMKATRLPNKRPKGRLTAHPLNMYTTAIEDVDNDMPNTDNDSDSIGCSVISTTTTELNDSVFPPKPTDVSTVTEQLVDVSHALINFDESQIVTSTKGDVSEFVNATLNKTESELVDDSIDLKMESVAPTESNAVSIVTAQSSNSSVITLSSVESEEVGSQEVTNQSVEYEDEGTFERSISCPPTELQDDLFENVATNCDNEEVTTDSISVIHTECQAEKTRDDNKLMDQSETQKKSFSITTAQQPTIGDTSFDQLCVNNDNDHEDDVIIPETQDVFSQEEVSSTSCIIIDCEKTNYLFEVNEKENVSENVMQNTSVKRLHPNMSVVSLSSDDDDEERDESIKETETNTKNEEASSPIKHNDNERTESTHNEQTVDLDQSEVLFSQCLFVDANECQTESKSNIKSSNSSAENVIDITNESNTSTTAIENDVQQTIEQMHDFNSTDTMKNEVGNPTNASFLSSTIQNENENDVADVDVENQNISIEKEISVQQEDSVTVVSTTTEKIITETVSQNIDDLVESEDNGVITPVATSSTITVLSTDTTQELNLQAFWSDVDIQSDDTMDKLEFTSSESMDGSDDSGNITASCANTSVNESSEAYQTESPSMQSMENVLMVENADETAMHISSNDEQSKTILKVVTNAEDKVNDEEINDNIVLGAESTVVQGPINNMDEIETEENSDSIGRIDNQIEEESTKDQENDTVETPSKNIIKLNKSQALTIPRYTKRSQVFLESAFVTPKRTPRKLNVKLAPETPSSNVEQPSETLSVKETLHFKENVPELASTEESPKEECVEPNDDEKDSPVFTTPAKMEELSVKSSTVTRSSRRQPNRFDNELSIPKLTPRKVNINNVPQISSETELTSSVESIKNVDDMTTKNEQTETFLEEMEENINSHPKQTVDECANNVNETNAKLIIEDEKNALQDIENIDQNETIECPMQEESKKIKQNEEMTTVHENINVAIETPQKIILKSEENHALTIPRYTNCRPEISEIASATPKRTPKKFNVKLAAETPSSNVEQPNETLTVKEDVLDLDSTKQFFDDKATGTSENKEDVAVLATPAKIDLTIKSSTITRSSRRQQYRICNETSTPKLSPRKLNMSNVLQTSNETEMTSPIENVQNDVSTKNELVLGKFEANEPKQTIVEDEICNEEINTTIVADDEMNTVQDVNKIFENESVEFLVEAASDNLEQIDDQYEETSKSQEKIIDAKETPSKNIIKSDESRALTIPRYTKRRQIVSNIASITPKRTPRKMLKTLASETSTSNVEQLNETMTVKEEVSELIPMKELSVEKCATPSETNGEDSVFAKAAKIEISVKSSTITHSTRRQQREIDNESTPKRTPSESEVTSSIEITPNDDDDVTPNEKQFEEKKNSEKSVVENNISDEKTNVIEEPKIVQKIEKMEQIEITEFPIEEANENLEITYDQNEENSKADENDVVETPSKNIIKSDESRALTIPQYTKRKQKISEIASITPKRTPRKVNVKLVVKMPSFSVEQPLETLPVKENVPELVSKAESSNEKSDNPSENKEDASVFATPAKVELAVKSSTITRSSRRHQHKIDGETSTPKRTPRKLNISNVPQTPSETEVTSLVESVRNNDDCVTSEYEQINEETNLEKTVVENEINEEETNVVEEKQNIVQEIKKMDQIKSDEFPMEETTNSCERNDDQAEENDVVETPSKNNTKLDESRAMTIPRYTKRKQIISGVASVTPKRIPRKLNAILAREIPSSNVEKPNVILTVKKDIPELASTQESCAMKCANPSENKEDATVFATPTKIELAVKSSTITRSSRRHQHEIDGETSTPKRKPRKLNISNVPQTPSETERTSTVDSIQNEDDMTDKKEQIESVLDGNESNAGQNVNDEIVTPPKNGINSDENRALTTPRYTKRRQIGPEIAFITPKRTPRKLNVKPEISSSNVEKPSETLTAKENVSETTQTVESFNDNNDLPDKDEKIETVLNQIETNTSQVPSLKQSEESNGLISIVDDNEQESNVNNSIQSRDDGIVISTPAKDELVTIGSTATYSTRRKNLVSERTTPLRTPRKLSIAADTPTKMKAENKLESKNNIPSVSTNEEDLKSNENVEKDVIIETTQDVDEPITELKQSSSKKQDVPQNDAPAKNSGIDNELQPNVNNQVKQAEDFVILSTPIKSEFVTKLVEECNSQAKRSSKRKRTDLAVETPVAKRTPRQVIQATPLKDETLQESQLADKEQPREESNEEAGFINNVFERVEAEMEKIHDDVAEQPANETVASRSTRRKNMNCDVKITPLRRGRGNKSKEEPVQVELQVSTEEGFESTQTSLNEVTPSTSDSNKQGKRIMTKSESKSKDTVSDLVAAVLSENEKLTALNEKEEQIQRIATPFPAVKKRISRLTGSKTISTIETGDVVQQNDVSDSNSDSTEDVIPKGKSLRKKKVEDTTIEQTSKIVTTPLNKRNRNLAVETNKECEPIAVTSNDDNNDEDVSKKSENLPSKSTRRNQKINDSKPVESTPKKLKTQLDQVILEAATTPHSLRSLRNRTISIDERSSVATPKRTRQPRKVLIDEIKTNDIAEIIISKDVETKETEVEKAKRQSKRKNVHVVETEKEPDSEKTNEGVDEKIENVPSTVVSKSSSKRATKGTRRTKTEEETVDEAMEKIDEEVESVQMPSLAKSSTKRATKGTRTKTDTVDDAKEKINEKEENTPDPSVAKPSTKRVTKATRTKTEMGTVDETKKGVDEVVESVAEATVAKPSSKRATKRTRTKLEAESIDEPKQIIDEEVESVPEVSVAKPSSKRVTKRTKTKLEAQSIDKPKEIIEEKAESVPEMSVAKSSSKRATKRTRTKSEAESVDIPKESVDEEAESIPKPIVAKATSRRIIKRTKTKSDTESIDDANEEISIKAGRRTRKNSQAQAHAIPNVDVVEVIATIEEESNEIKPKRGRPKKAVIETDEVQEPPAKKRTVRGRTVSKSEENVQKVDIEKSTNEEVNELEPTNKTRAKRSHKANIEVEVSSDNIQPPPKRTRNTKKAAKEIQPEAEPQPETVIEKKSTRKTKKITELDETTEPIAPLPISTRTRRHK